MINVYAESGLLGLIRPDGNTRVRLKALKFDVAALSTVIITADADLLLVSVGYGSPPPP